MAETYWEQAARGAVPQNSGWTSLVNPLAYTGQPIDMNALIAPQRSSQMGPAWDAANAASMKWKADRKAKNLQDSIFQQARDAQLAQQKATQSRLDEQIAGYKERRATAAKAMKDSGQGDADAINRRYDQLVARTKMDMGNSGLGQTTALTSSLSGIERDRAAALRDANSRNAVAASSVDLGASGDYLNFLGGIQDNFDIDPLLQMAMANGEATQNQLDPSAFGGQFFGGGGGGGGGYIGGSAYGGAASMGYGFADPMQYGGDGYGNWFGGSSQPRAASTPAPSRRLPMETLRAVRQLQDAARAQQVAVASNASQVAARQRISARNQAQLNNQLGSESGYGNDAALYGW